MTAEIALLNRRALAFAADSAVTISDGKNDKIYNSAEKIFQLSHIMPLGLMMYNTMEFVGVPIDVLVRRFRTEMDCEFETCEKACLEFISFISKFKRSESDEVFHLYSIISDEFREIYREHELGLAEVILSWMGSNQGVSPNIELLSKNFLLSLIEKHSQIHASRRLAGYLESISYEEFRTTYGANVTLISLKFFPPNFSGDSDVEAALALLSYNAVRSEVFSDGLTGLVVGGFGKDDIFPSLFAVEIDGIFFGQVKVRTHTNIDIDRAGERAAIVPFAQSEMVERFLFGIDSQLQKLLLKFISDTAAKTVAALEDAGVDTQTLKISSEEYAGDVERLLLRLKHSSKEEILDMVDFMPKQELAYAAEAFISLTSVKRKVSAQQETVGGPIDVAVITKNEGFVWIKRKHYFDMDLNPAYGVK